MPRSREVTFDLSSSSPGPQALRDRTEFSPWPSQGSPFSFTSKPLKGRVRENSFTVGLNETDWHSRLQPTARGTITTVGGRTQVTMTVGVAPIHIWLLRVFVGLAFPLMVAGWVYGLIAAGNIQMLFILGIAVAVVTALVVGIGTNMNHADKQVDVLADLVQRILSGTESPSTEEVPVDERVRSRMRQRAKAPEGSGPA